MTVAAEIEPRSEMPSAIPSASGCLTVIALGDVHELESHIPAWENLASHAIEPNVFQEHWMLLPALKQFAAGEQLILLVYAPHPQRPEEHGTLCGLFPLERCWKYKGLPLRHLRLWRHLHAVLATPLIRAGHAPEVLHALFDWLRTDPRGARLLELGFVAADGPFQHALINHCNEEGRLTFVDETTTRALLRVEDDADSYLKSAMSSGNRKELRRQRRRLGELGQLEARTLQAGDDAEQWIEQFLSVEASGWKGEHGTALSVHENEREFFRLAAREAFARQRLMMLGLFLDGKAIALKCNFLMGDGAIAFKIAFDENYARFSPGVQLELDNVQEAHARVGLRWMDSCAISRHFMINRLWKDRRIMQNVLVSTGRRGGDLAVSTFPLLRWTQRLFKRRQNTVAASS